MKNCLNAICSIFILLWSITTWAQGENMNWMFGHNTRLNFSQSPPVFYQSNMECWEGGTVSFSDASGNLLFYSNANKVWRADGSIMPHGNNILGNGPTAIPPYGYPGSSAQGAAAIQSISNPNQYYLFTLDAMEDAPPHALGYLRYSIIDMSLDGGMGDVIQNQKNIILDDSMTEKMTVIKADGCGFWLLTHKMYSNVYHTFKIDAIGLHATPVISTGVVGGELGYGMLHASPDGEKLVMTSSGPGVELCSFNKVSGEVFNAGSFSSLGGKIGTCISPDNSKLYIGHYNKLSQYDLTLFPNVAAVVASEEIVSTNVSFGQMRRGPDGKIYIANINANNIAIIQTPNDPGLSCNYELFGMSRPLYTEFPALMPPPSANQYGAGLGQEVMASANMMNTHVRSVKDTMVCNYQPVQLTVDTGFSSYIWSTGDALNAIAVTHPGTYWVKSIINCDIYVDSFHVTAINLEDWNLGNDTAICPGDVAIIDAAHPDIIRYTWQDGSHNAIYAVSDEGDYYVTIDMKGCELTDTIQVSIMNPYVQILEHDTLICNDSKITLHAIAFPQSIYLWNTGSLASELTVEHAGNYTVYANNACGTFSDSVKIETVSCDCKIFIPTAFSPNGDGKNDLFEVRMECLKLILFDCSIYNRYGQQLFQSNVSTRGWDGYINGQPADVGTYFFYLRYKTDTGDIIVKKGDISLIR
ncbi:MAG: gliding motility-associated C-terminal domain-containing protein [Taibaiella sp.]